MTNQNNNIVTVELDSNVSNTYKIYEGNLKDKSLLFHPLFPSCFILKDNNELNYKTAVIKDSTERSIDFVVSNKQLLNHDSLQDLEAVCLLFSVKRVLSPKLKNVLSNLGGIIASYKLNNNVQEAIKIVNTNVGILDEFNLMWYNNLKKLFNGTRAITTKNQRSSIFNMTGFVLAELKTPTITK